MHFIDIHSHILPGLDDGSYNREDSLEMARIAEAGSISHIICTPHAEVGCRYSANELLSVLKLTAGHFSGSGNNIVLHPGQEILIRNSAAEVPEALRRGELLTLAGSDCVLIEFKPHETAEGIYHAAEVIARGGYTPIIAHPERYIAIAEERGLAHDLHACGALLQINKGSLTGFFGKTAESTVRRLLENEQADFLASDAHGSYVRSPALAEAHEWISLHYSPEYADHLLIGNPTRILNGEKITPVHYFD